MFKKIFVVSLLVLASLTLSACKPKVFTVTFDSQGGTAVASVEVDKGEVVASPTAPTRDPNAEGKVYNFVGWYTDAAATSAYDFATAVEEDITLYASWTLNVVLHLETKTSDTMAPVLLGETGGQVTTPAAPTRDGYTFEGWYYGKPGLTWLEPSPVTFPITVTEETTLYAYWEPVDSSAVNYSDGETYTSSLDSSSTVILNPLTYRWSHENTFIDMMSTPLYSTEVDWDLAIEEGIAAEVNDFSKIIDGTYTVDAIDFINILVGATHFPIDSEGEEHLTEDGLYDRDGASSIKDTEWTFKLRDDVFWEDGTPVTAADYEYSLKMYLDPILNNYRANLYYKTAANKNGVPILNAYEYYTGTMTWDKVGFTVVDDYTFTVEFFEGISQSSAVGFGSINLVQEAAYEASLTENRTNSTYGTPDNPYVSYGSYLIKSWDENQKLVFNKNYDYVLRGTINYKSMVYEVVDGIDSRMSLYAAGDLSVAGLSQEYYNQYVEEDNVFLSWDGYPQYLLINTAGTSVTEGGNEHPSIIFDVDFRKALLYGFNRKYYANSVYQPNTASLLPIPLDTKSYNKDFLYYSQSPQHLQVLTDLGITPDSEGYIPDLAVQYFDAAYARWDAIEGNDGAVTIKLATDNDEFSLELVTYIKDAYEELFGTDKLIVELVQSDPTTHQITIRDWDFDLALASVGFGSSTGAWYQYQAFAFMGSWVGGADLGLSQPYDESTESGVAAYWTEEITINLENTWNYLEELGEDYMTDAGLSGHLQLWESLKAVADDPLTTEVDETKAAGIYVGTVADIGLLQLTSDVPFDGAAAEPFPGARNDSWNMIAAFEELFFNHVTLVPTVTRSSATIYASNVVIEWPAYSATFGWGAQRYRYLNTDPDFME